MTATATTAPTLVRACTPEEADDLLREAVALAGGTDLLVLRRAGLDLSRLVDLSGLPGPAVTTGPDGALHLSATAALTDVSTGLGDRFPGLAAAVAVFAAPTIRNRATLGGNLATGSPGADTVPPLVAAGAVVELRRAGDRRELAVGDFLLGPHHVALRPGEWVSHLRVPAPPAVGGMRKVAGRAAQAISFVSFAWQWELDTSGRRRHVRLAMGAVAPTVVRLRAAEAVLEGRAADDDLVVEAAAAAAADISPIDDHRASAAYRRRCVSGLLHEVLAP